MSKSCSCQATQCGHLEEQKEMPHASNSTARWEQQERTSRSPGCWPWLHCTRLMQVLLRGDLPVDELATLDSTELATPPDAGRAAAVPLKTV